MNVTTLTFMAACMFAVANFAVTSAEPPTGAHTNLIARSDANGNGRIDVEERKGYVRELARERHEAADRQAAKRAAQGGLKLEDLRRPAPTREQFRQHDANANGRLEPEEQARLEAAQREELASRFREADRNKDGVLDRDEFKPLRPSPRP